ncbi:O-acetyl-ADP-ribose deacetylase macrod2 [Mactra antiquata]
MFVVIYSYAFIKTTRSLLPNVKRLIPDSANLTLKSIHPPVSVTRRFSCVLGMSDKPDKKASKTDKTGRNVVESVKSERITRNYTRKAEENLREYYLTLPLPEKRKLYSCGSNYVTSDEVESWTDYAGRIKEKVKKASRPKDEIQVDEIMNMKISLWQGDVTKLEIDAIVNAANSTLLGGGGVDGAIHRAAGKKLLEECYTLNGCSTGQAKLSGGYKLPARYIIHTVGPIGIKPDMLQMCYENSLKLAKENNIRTIAFPCISTGIYGYDVEMATPVVMKTVRDWLQDKGNASCIDKIIFCVFLKNDVDVYQRNLLQYFPVDKCDPLESLPNTKRAKTISTEEENGEKENRNSVADNVKDIETCKSDKNVTETEVKKKETERIKSTEDTETMETKL